jgi:hypothetical protein
LELEKERIKIKYIMQKLKSLIVNLKSIEDKPIIEFMLTYQLFEKEIGIYDGDCYDIINGGVELFYYFHSENIDDVDLIIQDILKIYENRFTYNIGNDFIDKKLSNKILKNKKLRFEYFRK